MGKKTPKGQGLVMKGEGGGYQRIFSGLQAHVARRKWRKKLEVKFSYGITITFLRNKQKHF